MPRALVWRRVPELSVARLCRSRTADLDRRGTEVVEAYGANSYTPTGVQQPTVYGHERSSDRLGHCCIRGFVGTHDLAQRPDPTEPRRGRIESQVEPTEPLDRYRT